MTRDSKGGAISRKSGGLPSEIMTVEVIRMTGKKAGMNENSRIFQNGKTQLIHGDFSYLISQSVYVCLLHCLVFMLFSKVFEAANINTYKIIG